MMIDGWRRKRDRVQALSSSAENAYDIQRRLTTRLQCSARQWLSQVETLAWFGATGFVWGARMQNNRRSDERAQPVRELAGAAWLILSWRRLPQRVRKLIREFDPAGETPARLRQRVRPELRR
jgi:hypothetical protein